MGLMKPPADRMGESGKEALDALDRLESVAESLDAERLVGSASDIRESLATVRSALSALREENERLREERDEALRGNWGREPSDEGGNGHEETYWLRNKLRSAVIHLRDIEDFYVVRGGTPESYNIQRAQRARGIYEQISHDFINGKLSLPTMRERAESAEAELRLAREGLRELAEWDSTKSAGFGFIGMREYAIQVLDRLLAASSRTPGDTEGRAEGGEA